MTLPNSKMPHQPNDETTSDEALREKLDSLYEYVKRSFTGFYEADPTRNTTASIIAATDYVTKSFEFLLKSSIAEAYRHGQIFELRALPDVRLGGDDTQWFEDYLWKRIEKLEKDLKDAQGGE